jgi:hypothetical protein
MPGKKQGTKAYHRPYPKDKNVTEQNIFSLCRFPMCKGQVGEAVDAVIKYTDYNNLPGKKKCWVHAIRGARGVSEQLHNDLVGVYVDLLNELSKPIKKKNGPLIKEKLEKV